MRKQFINTLVELAEDDARIVLLTADLGFMVLEPFIDRFPDRFFNVGVAEQNMIGMATGLAEAGFIPFAYSIATFASLLPYEFIRNGPVLHNLPVRIIGVGGGFEYGHAGITHHALEDIGVMRTQPGLQVIAPADYEQTRAALLASWDAPGPIYFRLGKNDRDVVPGLAGAFQTGALQHIQPGSGTLFISMGSIALTVAQAVAQLAANGIPVGHAILASINPPPTESLIALLQNYEKVVTVESHYIQGGIGSLVAEVIAENRLDVQLMRAGVRGAPDGISGGAQSLQARHGLDVDALVGLVAGEQTL